MFRFKYYRHIEEEQAEPRPQGPADGPEIDFDRPAGGFLKRLGARVGEALVRGALWYCRTFWPNARIGRLVIVTRAADVCEVLNNSRSFEVPYRPEMVDLGGANSVLGMDDCPHAQMRGVFEKVIEEDDVARIREYTGYLAGALIRNSNGRIDVIGDLFTRCATESCARYFGLTIEDPDNFAGWTMAISQVLFADPFGDPETLRRGRYASQRVREVVNRAIAETRKRSGDMPPGGPPPRDTLVERFLDAQTRGRSSGIEVSDAAICANLVALITGSLPTIPLTAGKMLQTLRKRPKIWGDAIDAARKDDRGRLRAILFEAGRLNPALFPGQWRYCRAEGVIADHTLRRRFVPEGSVVLVATAAALRDPRIFPAPGAFRADRGQDPDLMFGYGTHHCIGSDLAMAQITEVFLALLKLEKLQPAKGSAGRMRLSGPFPRQLEMQFTPPDGRAPQGQSMIAVCAPLAKPDEAQLCAIRKAVADLGNPVDAGLQAALKQTGRIHFASLSVVDLGDAKRPLWHLLLEINADGLPDPVLSAISKDAGAWLGPIFAHAENPGGGLLETLRRYDLKAHRQPRSATHLNFNGVQEFSVADIDRQQDLAKFSRRAVERYLKDDLDLGPRPMLALRFVRQLIRGEVRLKPGLEPKAHDELAKLIQEGPSFHDFLIQPGRRRLGLADWVEVTVPVAWRRIATSKAAWFFWAGLGLVWFDLSLWVFLASGAWGWQTLPHLFLAIAVGFWGEILLLGLIGLGVVATLRFKEMHDVPDARFPSVKHLDECTAHEDEPGYAQNHFIATPMLKPGLFRRFTLASALWGIGTLIAYGFRPGFVLDMGTIHYAKWFRPPKSRRLVFFGNYDGSWSSYLEDFITKAHVGQTAGWSNCEGFPPTRFLTLDGAQDGDRFKRWVRRQQVPSACWFSHFPGMTTNRIRNNALIHHGLACAHTDSAARAWLACFGSQQRPEGMLETEEIQSLVFSGFGDFKHAVFAVLRLPRSKEKLGNWLAALNGASTDTPAPLPQLAVTFGDAPGGATRPASDAADSSYVRWGSTSPSSHTAVAFSASGLLKLGLPYRKTKGVGLGTFPGVFVTGMSSRARALGDHAEAAPDGWLWRDRGEVTGSDAVLMIYAKSREACDQLLAEHLVLLGPEAVVVGEVRTTPVTGDDLRREHFGFRDGISQPVIRGTQRFVANETAEDIVEPGEFILGYRANQGYFPTTPVVEASTDIFARLPTAQSESPQRFPNFAESPLGLAFHDFGRNGSYLVLRQLEQHVGAFEDFTKSAAKRLENDYPGLPAVVGTAITPKWVAAKLLGRWTNGTPLIDHPNQPPRVPKPDNTFAFGVDDPQGLRCPMGAHIRRANPRDSFQPGDPDGRKFVNRHRLLRRGRAYRDAGEAGERGLLFACLCADLERQFEFVQQTWINSPSFSGLDGETDPLLGTTDEREYTIPTAAGAVRLDGLPRFVTPRAGGYYFMPSRSALGYLADLHPPSQPERDSGDT